MVAIWELGCMCPLFLVFESRGITGLDRRRGVTEGGRVAGRGDEPAEADGGIEFVWHFRASGRVLVCGVV